MGEVEAVIFGASGFTGKYVIREFLKFLIRPDGQARRIALAGRSKAKLAAALAWAAAPKSPPDLPLIEADVQRPESLKQMCRRTKLVLDCVGPYRLYGEPVVQACVEAGIDYLDITGEPEFMEKMELLYHERAKESSSLVVSACGFDSIPAEIGLLHHVRQWGEEEGVPNSVDAYLKVESTKAMGGNIGTWESAVLGVGNAGELRRMRQKRRKQRLEGGGARVKVPGAMARRPQLLSRNKELGEGLWTVPLPSADASVVRRTLAAIAGRPPASIEEEEEEGLEAMAEARRQAFKPVHFGISLATNSLLTVIALIWTGLSLLFLARFSWGRHLLLRFPGFFSFGIFRHGGPSEEQIAAASFHMWFIGKGYRSSSIIQGIIPPHLHPDTQIVTRLSGPEIGYITTPICLVQCALILLDQRRSLPRGGVFSPGVAFGTTDLQQRLHANGITFDLISKSKIHLPPHHG